MSATTRFAWLSEPCTKCGGLKLEASVNVDAQTVSIECTVCFAGAKRPISREEAQAVIAELKRKSKE